MKLPQESFKLINCINFTHTCRKSTLIERVKFTHTIFKLFGNTRRILKKFYEDLLSNYFSFDNYILESFVD